VAFETHRITGARNLSSRLTREDGPLKPMELQAPWVAGLSDRAVGQGNRSGPSRCHSVAKETSTRFPWNVSRDSTSG